MTESKLLPKKTLKKNEAVIFTFNERCIVKWIWESDTDFDLCAFYKTQDGNEGGVFSNDFRGNRNDLGFLDKSPFMKIAVDEIAPWEVQYPYEKISISSLNEIRNVFFCIIHYDSAINETTTNFEGKFELISDTGCYLEIPVTTSKQGQVFYVARIDVKDKSFLLSNAQRVLQLREAFDGIPGFNLICRR